ncbi:MAG: hypothetical protein IJW32_01180 [Clostridia bacterium]|nr:hypothetical protein [Clostridia bacterium]
MAEKIEEKQLKKGFAVLLQKLKKEKFNQYKIDISTINTPKIKFVEEFKPDN